MTGPRSRRVYQCLYVGTVCAIWAAYGRVEGIGGDYLWIVLIALCLPTSLAGLPMFLLASALAFGADAPLSWFGSAIVVTYFPVIAIIQSEFVIRVGRRRSAGENLQEVANMESIRRVARRGIPRRGSRT